MNKFLFFGIIFLLVNQCFTFAQQSDSIILQIELDTLKGELHINQEFKLYNHSQKTLTEVYFHAWANAYSGRKTELSRSKLEDQKGFLYFSTEKERGGIKDLLFFDSNENELSHKINENEFVKVSLPKVWKKNEKIHLKSSYSVKIPSDAITQYGKNEDGDYLLKYFFLEVATLNSQSDWVLQHYKDLDNLASYPSTFIVQFKLPENYRAWSDLKEENGIWTAQKVEHFRVFLSSNPQKTHSFLTSDLSVDFGYSFDKEDLPIIDSLLPNQIQFLENCFGKLPVSHLFISAKTKKEQNFLGADDLDIWIKKVKLFSNEERNALKLFQVLSYEYIDRLFSTNKTENHWLKNGLQFYAMMKYVDRNFPNMKLTGNLPDEIKLLGMKPLKLFHASNLDMNDRYKLLYLYVARQNYDQPINTPYDELSNLNEFAISGFKTGLSFYYINEYLGGNTFDVLMKDFFAENSGEMLSQLDFRNYLIENSPKSLEWFFDDYIDKKDKINFKLLSVKETDEDFQVKIKNSTRFSGPFLVVGSKNGLDLTKKWYRSQGKKTLISFPKGEYDKISLNPDYLFPEFNDRDNSLRTKGLFKNRKKPQLKLFSDIENPEYTQFFISPQIRWNNYDKLLIGFKLHNQSLLTRPYKWAIAPKLSTGTGKLTGSTHFQNTLTPRSQLFRAIILKAITQYEHYAKDLTFFKWSLFADANFKKSPRSSLNHGIQIGYTNLNKKVADFQVQTDEDKYGLSNFTYYYSRPNYIHETYGSVTFQSSGVFRKIFGEAYYRWRFSPKKQLGIRIFAGFFLSNQSDTDYFNFGLSTVSDYAFNLNMLGRSESSGLLSRQYFLAETGFKSLFESTVNQWVVSSNWEFPIFTVLDVYFDMAVFKNRLEHPDFLYDSGFKFKLIPDFIEFYFPVQSSLGFEPAQSHYTQKIRFTLKFDLKSIINHLRRGWY